MTVRELSREQLMQVKQAMLPEGCSWEELVNVDRLVSDEECFEEYDGVEFVADDFM